MERFAARLKFGDKDKAVCDTTLRIIRRMKTDWISEGRRPAGLCGAGIVITQCRCLIFAMHRVLQYWSIAEVYYLCVCLLSIYLYLSCIFHEIMSGCNSYVVMRFCFIPNRGVQFAFSGCVVPAFQNWFSTTFIKIVVEVMTAIATGL